MENEKRLIDVNVEIRKMKYVLTKMNAGERSFALETLIAGLERAPTVDAVEVVHIDRVKQEILQQMDMFIAEYNRIGFYNKSDAMDIAKRLVNSTLTDLCHNCSTKMDG